MSDRLEQLKIQQEQLKNKIRQIEDKEKEKSKKLDTRRKILIGALMLQEMKDKPDTEKTVINKLDKFLTKERDRELFGFATLETIKPISVK